MMKKIAIYLLLCLSILGVQSLIAEEKFLSLKKNKTNVRYGPGLDYPIKYIYRKNKSTCKTNRQKRKLEKGYIDLDNNSSGWIHWSQLKPSNSIIILKDKSFV